MRPGHRRWADSSVTAVLDQDSDVGFEPMPARKAYQACGGVLRGSLPCSAVPVFDAICTPAMAPFCCVTCSAATIKSVSLAATCSGGDCTAPLMRRGGADVGQVGPLQAVDQVGLHGYAGFIGDGSGNRQVHSPAGSPRRPLADARHSQRCGVRDQARGGTPGDLQRNRVGDVCRGRTTGRCCAARRCR